MSTAPQIPLTAPLAKVLRLHGEPFADLLQNTEFAPGEPVHGFAVDLEVPENVRDMVDHIIQLGDIYNPLASFEERESQIDAIEVGFKSIIRDGAMQFDDETFAIFDRHFAIEVLSTLSSAMKRLPDFDAVMASADPAAVLSEYSESIQWQLHVCGFLQRFSSHAEDRGEVGKIMAENFFHDAFGYYCDLRDTPGYFARNIDRLNSVDETRALKFRLEEGRAFVTRILDGNLAIARDKFEAVPFDLAEEISPAVLAIAARFGLALKQNGVEVYEGSNATITWTHDHAGKCYGNAASMALVVYNLIKNPVKGARMSCNPLPDVKISTGYSSDGRCTSILIRDEGLGFSLDELRKKFTGAALEKLNSGQPLSFIEECLVDEAMQEHIPFKAYADLVCNRGASTGSGTGIGLHLARSIIEEGHQGAIRLYNHPESGAAVQILLPLADNSVDKESRKQITRDSLQHQLEYGMR